MSTTSLHTVFGLLLLLVHSISSVKLSALPSVLTHSGDSVVVTWTDAPSPSADDLILIHSPVPSTLSNNTAIGQFSVTISPQWASGSGSFSFPMTNIRAEFCFQYISVSSSPTSPSWVPQASSNTVRFENNAEPTQGHLALTKNPQEMRVMWVSSSNAYPPTVVFGTDPDELINVSKGTSSTYSSSDLCDAPANSAANGGWRDPGYQHDVLLVGLEPSTQYYYRFGNDVEGWSQTYDFVSSPGVGPEYSVDFIMFGDMGVQTPFNHTNYWENLGIEQQSMAPKSLKWIKRYMQQNSGKPKLILDVGDISYARGYAVLWDWYMESIAPIAARAPWMVGIGNHEYDYHNQPWRPVWSEYGSDSFGECAVPYSNRFNMPGPSYSMKDKDGQLRNLWYSFDMGPVHFVFMSTEHNFLIGSPQWNWLDQDLSSVNRSLTPWIVFMGHRPIYTSSCCTVGNKFDDQLRANIQPMLYKYKVDLVLVGHVHAYERMCGFTEGFQCAERDEDGVVHVVVGGAGNTYQAPWDTKAAYDHKRQPEWSIFRSDNWGISELHVNATTLHLLFYGDQRGEAHDQLILRKESK